ncbi:M20/M25/M40 family metallo-hydrolase [Streptomyces sp. AS02]|uniref:M20/M25/M40 family metallo-hydrolase n=1 Tax=Streptomyces sp. AS02 TaxID=2938946 RepID=UPI002021DB17|nr:M20/M25/M40 family metallo-hydrolase [Streptomyces sp. AS02]MCL8017551.1 M20/M25/M40 family metallo-hydrolase [Streptomyces sp. AS02]
MTTPQLESDPAADAPPPGAAPVRRPRLRGLPSLLLLALVALIAVGTTVADLSVPKPLGADAPAGQFSATRAHRHVERIATEPRPVGSAAHDRVRDYLLAELRKAGLSLEVLPAVGVETTRSAAVTGRMQNIRATIPGTDPTGRVLLVAHYDSVELGPGATDDGHGVAAILETVRALRSGPAPRNDVTVLLTDGEEPGMVGAQAYATSSELGDPDRTVVLNLESRGTSGRVVMFETGAHNSALVPALSGHVPVTTSLAYEVYRLLPNYTDFTAFREAGLTGMNFANVAGSANYDTAQDNLANSSRASLQDLGSTTLAATRELGAADIAAVAEGSDATYFSLGGLLVRYPGALVLPLAALATAGFAAAVWWAVRRSAVSGRRVGVAAATVPLPLLGAAGVGWAAWQLLLLVRPDYAGFVNGDPYRPGVTAAGFAVLAVAVVWIWAALLRRGCGALEVSAAVTGWLTALAVVTALLTPGASYLFVWPALFGAAGLAVAARLPAHSPLREAAGPCAGLPGALLLVPVAVLLFPTLGLATAAGPLLVVALFAATLPLPFTGARPRMRILALRSGLALATGLAVIAAGVARDGVDSRHPSQVSLVYALDGDTHRARWASTGLGSHAWLDPYVDGGEARLEDAFPPMRWPGIWRTGAADRRTAPSPTLKVVSSRRQGDARVVRLHVAAESGSPEQLMLFVDTRNTTVVSGGAEGRRLPGGDTRESLNGRWTWGYTYVAPPAGGFDLTLTVRGKGPLRVRAVAQTTGFPQGALRTPPPPTLTWSALDSGFTLVTRAFTV